MPNKTTNPKKTEVAPKDGSVSTPKDDLSNTQASRKQWLKNHQILIAIGASLILIITGFLIWMSSAPSNEGEDAGLTQEEIEFQKLIDDSTKAPTAQELEETANAQKDKIISLQTDAEKAAAYYELANTYLYLGDFDNLFMVVKEAENSAKAAGDSELQKKAQELEDRAKQIYEQTEAYL